MKLLNAVELTIPSKKETETWQKNIFVGTWVWRNYNFFFTTVNWSFYSFKKKLLGAGSEVWDPTVCNVMVRNNCSKLNCRCWCIVIQQQNDPIIFVFSTIKCLVYEKKYGHDLFGVLRHNVILCQTSLNKHKLLW